MDVLRDLYLRCFGRGRLMCARGAAGRHRPGGPQRLLRVFRPKTIMEHGAVREPWIYPRSGLSPGRSRPSPGSQRRRRRGGRDYLIRGKKTYRIGLPASFQGDASQVDFCHAVVVDHLSNANRDNRGQRIALLAGGRHRTIFEAQQGFPGIVPENHPVQLDVFDLHSRGSLRRGGVTRSQRRLAILGEEVLFNHARGGGKKRSE
jgi:hypothetical protein